MPLARKAGRPGKLADVLPLPGGVFCIPCCKLAYRHRHQGVLTKPLLALFVKYILRRTCAEALRSGGLPAEPGVDLPPCWSKAVSSRSAATGDSSSNAEGRGGLRAANEPLGGVFSPPLSDLDQSICATLATYRDRLALMLDRCYNN